MATPVAVEYVARYSAMHQSTITTWVMSVCVCLVPTACILTMLLLQGSWAHCLVMLLHPQWPPAVHCIMGQVTDALRRCHRGVQSKRANETCGTWRMHQLLCMFTRWWVGCMVCTCTFVHVSMHASPASESLRCIFYPSNMDKAHCKIARVSFYEQCHACMCVHGHRNNGGIWRIWRIA